MRWLLFLLLAVMPLDALAYGIGFGSTTRKRQRWDVVCPMTSDTCSDGRKITTVRPSPVPCETAPGVWEIVPADVGCYGVRGLESWASNTSYLSWGAQLDREPWAPILGGAVEVLPDGYRIHPAAGQGNSGLTQAGLVAIPAGGESRTLACIVRTHQPAYLRYWVAGSQSVSFPAVETGGRWEVVAGTREVTEGSSPSIRVGNGSATESPIPFDVKACWLPRSTTPGRPVWGGEAPVSVAPDRHSISTEGWPTEKGEISFTFSPGPIGGDGRTILAGGASVSCRIQVLASGALQVGHCPGWTSLTASGLTWDPSASYVGKLSRDAGGTVKLSVNGAVVVEGVRPPFTWDPEMNIGTTGTTNFLNGSISRLSWRTQ